MRAQNASRRRLACSVAMLMLALATLVSAQDAMQFGARTLKNYVRPVVPPIAQTMRLNGTVRLEIVISPAGKVISTKSLGGHPLLVESATLAVTKWQFNPAPQETTTTVSVDFK